MRRPCLCPAAFYLLPDAVRLQHINDGQTGSRGGCLPRSGFVQPRHGPDAKGPAQVMPNRSVYRIMENKEHHNKFMKVGSIYFAAILILSLLIRDWLAAQTIAVVLTGLVLIWYTIETQLLRKESQKQTEIQIRPFVIVERKDRKIFLKNIGQGPALNVSVRPVQISSEETNY